MEKLGIDTKILIAQVINFLLLLFLLSKYVYKPFLATLDKEAKKAKENEESGREYERKEKELLEKKQEIESDYEKKLKAFYAKMKKETEGIKKQMIKEAETEAEEIRKHNMELINSEKEKGLAEVRQEASKIALAMTEKVLSEVLNADLQKQVTEQVINKLEKNNHGPSLN